MSTRPTEHKHLTGNVKSAATAWLRSRDLQADFEFSRPGGAPIGSVVDIQLRNGGLRVHLDQAVAPAWDDEREPVLGVSVPVDRDTLIRRWYVHRIRLDNEGTARRVLIGTDAFARPTEWFALDECKVTERGLTTPAVERIVKAHTTAPPPRWPAAKTKKEPDVEARAQVLLRQLAGARKVESVVVVNRVCREIAGLAGVGSATQIELVDAVRDALQWLQGQADVRRELFARLDEAVTAGNAQQARQLLARASATAAHDRAEDEHRIAGAAADFVGAQSRV